MEIPKLEFRDYGPDRLLGTPNDFTIGMNTGPDAWHLPFVSSIGTRRGGCLCAHHSIEQARELHKWLGKALAVADAQTEAA